MCLTLEWFEESTKRETHRKTHGVTIKEANEALRHFKSTAHPIAEEMAEWIYNNWPLTKIVKLSKGNIRDLKQYIFKKHGSDMEKIGHLKINEQNGD
jgi:hypothetical protein